MQQGFTRLETDDEIIRIDELLKDKPEDFIKSNCYLVIDRISVQNDEDTQSRIAGLGTNRFF